MRCPGISHNEILNFRSQISTSDIQKKAPARSRWLNQWMLKARQNGGSFPTTLVHLYHHRSHSQPNPGSHDEGHSNPKQCITECPFSRFSHGTERFFFVYLKYSTTSITPWKVVTAAKTPKNYAESREERKERIVFQNHPNFLRAKSCEKNFGKGVFRWFLYGKIMW